MRDSRSIGEMTHEAAATVGVVPSIVEALALERVSQGVSRLGCHRVGEGRVGDNLVATCMIPLVQRTSDDCASPAAQKEARGDCGMPWAS